MSIFLHFTSSEQMFSLQDKPPVTLLSTYFWLHWKERRIHVEVAEKQSLTVSHLSVSPGVLSVWAFVLQILLLGSVLSVELLFLCYLNRERPLLREDRYCTHRPSTATLWCPVY